MTGKNGHLYLRRPGLSEGHRVKEKVFKQEMFKYLIINNLNVSKFVATISCV
jgi:hypothetical protein